MMARHIDRPCEIIRFPREDVPAALMPYLDLDETRTEAMDALINQGRSDANMTNSWCNDPNCREGKYVSALFNEAPEVSSDALNKPSLSTLPKPSPIKSDSAQQK
jgi:hypothetical protein